MCVAVLAAAVSMGGAVAAAGQEPVDQAVIARIKTEGFQHSAVMDTLSWLSDVYGPRLTGSANLHNAAVWARDRMTHWGLEHAALEPYGSIGRGWDAGRFSIEMTEPQYMRITGYPRAWSPAIESPIVGTPIVVDVRSKEDFAKYHGKLRGAIVMNGRPEPRDIGFTPEATRESDDDLKKLEGQIDPAAHGLKSYQDEEQEFVNYLKNLTDVWKFFGDEGVAALITPSPIPEDVRVDGFYDRAWRSPYPAFVISREHYGRIMRMLDRKVPVKLSLSLDARFTDNVEGYNVVAEIPGTDPALASQVVMLGGHLDSWHSGTGATDNGAGSAVVMEAVRILKAIGVKPRRTIRVALWTGEEQDYFGSVGYVEKHFGDLKTLALKPEHAKLAAYFNLDNGSGRIRGIDLQGNEAARPIFEAWLAPFRYLGATTVSTLNTGGTDHMPFDALGLPGFQFIQDPLNYETRVHHSNLDVYEEAQPDDLKQAAVIMASFVYDAAMRDQMLPRKELPKGRPGS
ncbi:MAG: M20/M25/M40 family metallo-hydrolase [Betaproteobacteria bacterium]